jgi:hypothetical protein
MPISALWPYLDPAPLAQTLLWGFVGGLLSPNSIYRVSCQHRAHEESLYSLPHYARPPLNIYAQSDEAKTRAFPINPQLERASWNLGDHSQVQV